MSNPDVMPMVTCSTCMDTGWVQDDTRDPGQSVWWWCPGCETHHRVVVKVPPDHPNTPVWGFNGDLERPTFTPSVLVNKDARPDDVARGAHRCHCFVREGMIQFLGDCTHSLAGKTVPIEAPKVRVRDRVMPCPKRVCPELCSEGRAFREKLRARARRQEEGLRASDAERAALSRGA